MATATITVEYNDGYSKNDNYTLDCPAQSNVETAMKAAYDKYYGSQTPFSYMLVFYGKALGYFVQSLNGIPGNRVSGWDLFVNGVQSATGIDGTMLNDGDTVTFSYRLDKDIHATVSQAKRSFYA
jgi:hypothetical protein